MRALVATLLLLVVGLVLAKEKDEDQPPPQDQSTTCSGTVRDNIKALKIREAAGLVSLFEIRLESAKIDFEQADADREFAKDAEQRLAELQDAVSKSSYREARNKLRQAELVCREEQADIKEAKQNLELARIRHDLAKAGCW